MSFGLNEFGVGCLSVLILFRPRCMLVALASRVLQGQLAHDDAHDEKQHDESDHPAAQPLLFHSHRRGGVRSGHYRALPHPQAVVFLLGPGGAARERRIKVRSQKRTGELHF